MTLNTLMLLAGHVLMLALLGALWLQVPAPGQGKPRYVGTAAEPIVLAAYSAGFAVATAIMVAGYLNSFT